jgi:hypothetical protein
MIIPNKWKNKKMVKTTNQLVSNIDHHPQHLHDPLRVHVIFHQDPLHRGSLLLAL